MSLDLKASFKVWISYWIKSSLITSTIHSLVVRSISSLTKRLCPVEKQGHIRLNGWILDSHVSFHILIWLPLPTTHPRPFCRTSCPAEMALYPCDAFSGAEQLSKDACLQYLSSRVQPNKEWSYFKIVYIESLKISISLNPRSPTSYRKVNLS